MAQAVLKGEPRKMAALLVDLSIDTTKRVEHRAMAMINALLNAGTSLDEAAVRAIWKCAGEVK